MTSTTTYGVSDWLMASQGALIVANAPGEGSASVTFTGSGATQGPSGEFRRFADLASKLFAVPKSEVDG